MESAHTDCNEAIAELRQQLHVLNSIHGLAANLLRLASDDFCNHGCNDFDLPSSWSLKEKQDFVFAYHEWNGDPEEYDPGFLQLPDFAVMTYLAYLLDGKKKNA